MAKIIIVGILLSGILSWTDEREIFDEKSRNQVRRSENEHTSGSCRIW